MTHFPHINKLNKNADAGHWTMHTPKQPTSRNAIPPCESSVVCQTEPVKQIRNGYNRKMRKDSTPDFGVSGID
jgi:hypothetical protein